MKIDFFNKNKIKYLEGEIDRLWYNLNQKEKQIKELEDRPKNDYHDEIQEIVLRLKAITEFLKIRFEEDWIDDPYREPMRQPKLKILKAVKK